MDFSPSWDRHLLRFFSQTHNDYAVLSVYPANLHELGKNVQGCFEVPHLCQVSASRAWLGSAR